MSGKTMDLYSAIIHQMNVINNTIITLKLPSKQASSNKKTMTSPRKISLFTHRCPFSSRLVRWRLSFVIYGAHGQQQAEDLDVFNKAGSQTEVVCISKRTVLPLSAATNTRPFQALYSHAPTGNCY